VEALHLKTVEPERVSTTFYVNPLVAVFAGWLMAHEPVTLQMIIAAVVILLGVLMINLRVPKYPK
jgi:drug/metabolite transporter (DMT)-like permease